MLYVQLDTNWPDHPKIIRAGIEGAGLHAFALCLAKRLEKDGWVERVLLYRYGATDGLIDRLVDLDLLEDGDDRVRPDGWLDRNPSQAAIDANRAMKKEAGRRGNHDRWHRGVSFEQCEKCQVIAGSDRTGSHELSPAIGGDPIPTSRGIVRAEVATAIPPATGPIPEERRRTALDNIAAIRQQPFDNPNPAANGNAPGAVVSQADGGTA